MISLSSIFLLALLPSSLHASSPLAPTSDFRSRPDLHAPTIDLQVFAPELVSPGYIFLTPYRNEDAGPYIYDNLGQLVWSGAGTQGASDSHNLHVCEYKAKDHLCFFQGHQHHGWARGHGVIMDVNYRVVRTVEAVGSATQTDMHEFRLIDGGKRALVTVYQPRAYDLGPFGIGPGLGWIQDSMFQEIDVETGELLFEWRALDHIAPSFSYTCIACTDTSGDGLTRDTPWDYFHINSIDKNSDGDYLISARHVAAVYKISGKDGQILWQLNGANPTFKNNENLHFSSQHHAQWIAENDTHAAISLFDNASNTFNKTHPESRGMLVGINYTDRSAIMLREWVAPEKTGISAGSQGNTQILPNHNVFIGWGDHAFYSEHLDTGEAVMYGKLAQWGSDVMMYRCNKYSWVGNPLTTPSLWTYSKSGTNDSSLQFYVSWNGATQVRAWKFYTSDSASGPWTMTGLMNKTGFETNFSTRAVKEWSFAEAIDGDGKPLKRSSVTKTFVPSEFIVAGCDDQGCNPIPHLREGEVFEKTIPVVSNRGKFYTQGYNTARYYPELSRRLVSIPSFGIAFSLGVAMLILLAVGAVLGSRRVLGILGSCVDGALRLGRGEGGVRRRFAGGVISPRYQKLDSEQGTT
ncbi:hypothetical protein P280DRAFT_468973 [Massarina eburnea CBS 473.64]|uniref:Arylsulfotransferase n=1 Tax=Massarina eburnea CBS 473.64 TaxID=1395130 RepID=A0A6A6S0G6_9PLEO|nr:hypothetical protein P280DRAFT_468973 [Massarina eburnea CBS 473.64]